MGGLRPSGAKRSDGLKTALLKTPTAQLAVNGGSQHPDKRREGGHGPTLADQVEHLLPTPRAADGNGRRSLPDTLLPTPLSADGGLNRGSSAGYGLRNVSQEIWRGDHMSQPSAAGKPSSDGQLPGQLSLDELESA